MAQVDLLVYSSSLFWFFILFSLLYFLIYSYIVKIIYFSLKLRKSFFFTFISKIDTFFFNSIDFGLNISFKNEVNNNSSFSIYNYLPKNII